MNPLRAGLLPEEIADELQLKISALARETKPSEAAQRIRAKLSTAFDSQKTRQWLADYAPEYVWDLVDIAAQMGLDYRE